MILLVDAGNSRLKWSVLDAQGQCSPQQAKGYDGQPALAAFVWMLEACPAATHITLVHVLNTLFDDGVRACCAERGIRLHIVYAQAKAYGITSGYQNPQALGADRFVGLLAAHRLAGAQASIVIDCGTAVTIDAVAKDGRHLGGLILPGLQLSAEALIRRAQGRLSLSFGHPTVFADGTSRAIGGGSLFGLVGAIEGICTRMQHAMPTPCLRVLTGGDAEHLRPWLPGEYHVQADLLMQGLRHITERQCACTCG